MPVTAKLQFLRIAPRKVRLAADLIRGKSVEEAQTILSFTIKKAGAPLLKLLNSAVASAKNNFQMDKANLYIFKLTVDEGPKYKRWMPRARGAASEIQKKTSHITLVLDETVKKPKKARKSGARAKPGAGPVPHRNEISGAGVKKARPGLVERVEKIPPVEKPKPKPELEIPKPKIEKGVRRIFRRKAF